MLSLFPGVKTRLGIGLVASRVSMASRDRIRAKASVRLIILVGQFQICFISGFHSMKKLHHIRVDTWYWVDNFEIHLYCAQVTHVLTRDHLPYTFLHDWNEP